MNKAKSNVSVWQSRSNFRLIFHLFSARRSGSSCSDYSKEGDTTKKAKIGITIKVVIMMVMTMVMIMVMTMAMVDEMRTLILMRLWRAGTFKTREPNWYLTNLLLSPFSEITELRPHVWKPTSWLWVRGPTIHSCDQEQDARLESKYK